MPGKDAHQADVFICHASEDKAQFVQTLAEALRQAALQVWYDEFSLQLGDSLRRSIDEGLKSSRFGIVVLSKAFFAKEWPQYELDGLVQREVAGRKVILPIWHGVTREQVAAYSPSLADRVAVRSDQHITQIVRSIARVVYGADASPAPVALRSGAPHGMPDAKAQFDEELNSLWKRPRPVSFDNIPYWYVRIYGAPYDRERISTLSDCRRVLSDVTVSFRGWDFPYLDQEPTHLQHGNNWISSWNDYSGAPEYWRFYQSGQFAHFVGVREYTQADWRARLAHGAKSRLRHIKDVDWDSVPGYLDIVNFVWTASEIYEFAARMCREGVYPESVNIRIELRGIEGFVLMAGERRAWRQYCVAGENTIGRDWEHESERMRDAAGELTLDAVVWFFERFGWLEVSLDVLRSIQQELRK